MKGLELSKRYFYEICYPILEKEAGDILPFIACGLVGEGSECYGIDDEISQDHDFGSGFCIWLEEERYQKYESRLNNILKKIDTSYNNFPRLESRHADKRIGVFSIEMFYKKYTNHREFPISDEEFLKIPETFLSTCTNGEVFIDNYKKFSEIRAYLKNFYPSDVYKKKLSYSLANIAQSGQYNYPRSLKREDTDAMFASKAEFMNATYKALYLLAYTYMPYYKLRYRYLESLNYYPKELFDDLKKIELSHGYESFKLMEKVCIYILNILRFRSLVNTEDTFLITAAEELIEKIENKNIKNIHIMKEN